MDELLLDLRFALRFLLRNKRTTLVAIACLALGIAVTTTVFSAVNPWVLKPLPWEDPEELVTVSESQPRLRRMDLPVAGPTYLDLERENRVFEELAAYRRTQINLSTDDEPQRIQGARISHGLFPLLREKPVLGRLFSADEDVPGRGDVVLIAYELWVRHFARDPAVVGRTVRIDGRSHTIVGVMRPRFAFPEWAQAWTPLGLSRDGSGRGLRNLETVARLRSGVSLAQARSDVKSVARELESRHPLTNAGWSLEVTTYREELIPEGVRKGLSLQLAASFFVLLIACANAANLLLAQATAREREIALRCALGATRGRIVRQLLTESVTMALVAGALGTALAPWIFDALIRQAPLEPPYWVGMGVDGQVLAFALLVSLATGVGFGLAPALRASRSDLVASLKEGGRSATRGVQHHRLARGLVGAELALSVVLLVGATLMIRSYLAMQAVDMGLEREGVLTWSVTLSGAAYETAEQRAGFVRDALRRVEALPGVEAVGAANFLPVGRGGRQRAVEAEGQPVEYGKRPMTTSHTVTPDFMRAVGVRLPEGRGIAEDDFEHGREVAVVSRALAERFWPGQSALGRRIRLGAGGPWRRIVGVAGNIRQPFDLAGGDSPLPWQVWVPLTPSVPETVTFALRSRADVARLAPLVRHELRAMDADMPLFSMLTMDEVVLRVIWISRTFGLMFAGLAVLALVLASIGVYGLISYSVSQRTHEMGVRLALGAQPADVLGMVVRQGLALTGAGVASGAVAAFAVSRALASLLFGVDPWDLQVFAGTTALLASVSLLATFLPARRATRVDPVVALRSG